ncbi:MAG TPA: IS21 family transposase [Deltaproteobacteria bacterium]|nr:IS21 family transposase [Deltaproteobacteria bacterium]
MLTKEDWMDIKAQIAKGVYQKDVAKQLGVNPKTISRALKRDGPPSGKRPTARASKLDVFKPAIDELLRANVWNGEVIYREIQSRGYTGGTTIVRDYIRPRRSLRESRATVRFETDPGRQMQNDWGETVTMVAGRRERVYFSVNTLGYSRRFHFWCTDSNDAEHTYEGMIRSCEHFGGVCREVLVDNQKSTVISHRIGDRVRFNERFIDFAGRYGFTPMACRPYRARTKGKDERMVGYIKNNFFVRYRAFESFAHMNELAARWLEDVADLRVHGTVKEVVKERFSREAPFLGPLPAVRYDTSYRDHRTVHWDGYIDVRGNRYSVPSALCGQTVAIRISLDGRLTVSADDVTVAEHALRSVSEGWVNVPVHHADLWRRAFHVERRKLSAYEEVIACS